MNDSSYEPLRGTVENSVDPSARPERRRRWASAQKLRIVQETLEPGAVATLVARRYGISTGLLYTWRKQALAGALAGFLPVRIVPEEAAALVAPPEDGALAAMPHSEPAQAIRPAGLIEIELPSGVRLRVGADVDSAALGQVLAALRNR